MRSLRIVYQDFDILVLQGEQGWIYQSSRKNEDPVLSSCVAFATQEGAEIAAKNHVDRQIIRDQIGDIVDNWAEKKLLPWQEYTELTKLLSGLAKQ